MGDVIKEGVIVLVGKVFLYSGFFICFNLENKIEENDLENYGFFFFEIGIVIKVLMENGVKGICLFIFKWMIDNYWDVFEKVIY